MAPPLSNSPRFEDLTETTGVPLAREGADMMYSRYRLAADRAANQRVLELACGAGQGLGMVGASARSTVGGDFSLPLLRLGRRHFGARVPFARLSADRLPFASGAFDLVLFFEASYYVHDMEGAFDEIARVLAPGGAVLFVNANPERPDFIRSPHSVHYHTADEFRAALSRRGFKVSVEGAFPVEDRESGSRGIASRGIGLVRRGLERLGLVPTTLRGRARLKRLVYGRMVVVPAELSAGFGAEHPREEIGVGPASRHKVVYVSARKSDRA